MVGLDAGTVWHGVAIDRRATLCGREVEDHHVFPWRDGTRFCWECQRIYDRLVYFDVSRGGGGHDR